MIFFRYLCAVVLITSAMVTSSYGIAGFGLHWGNDFSLSMDDTEKEWVGFEALSIDTAGLGLGDLPSGMTGIAGDALPLYVTRTGWEKTMLNFGGKVYVDIIPFIDAVELSANFGLWQYEGSITYPTGLSLKDGASYDDMENPEDLFVPEYKTVPLSLKSAGMNYFGLGRSKTPYAKLAFDLTVRKYIFTFPPVVNMFRIYGGGGFTLNFATPVLHSSIIEKALKRSIEGEFSLEGIDDLFGATGTSSARNAIIEYMVDELMTPHFGCHIDLGTMVKFPMVPFGIYVDGKFMIPFGDLDKNVDLGGFGVVLNTGLSISI